MPNSMMDVTIYTDGASKGNPGCGGFGAILCYVDGQGVLHKKELSAGFRKTTNNRMEMLGVITALEALKAPCNVLVCSDSKYVVDAFEKNWIASWVKKGWKLSNNKPVKNRDLWLRLLELVGVHTVRFQWVKGHAGHEYNERADELANEACADEAHWQIDSIFEQGCE